MNTVFKLHFHHFHPPPLLLLPPPHCLSFKPIKLNPSFSLSNFSKPLQAGTFDSFQLSNNVLPSFFSNQQEQQQNDDDNGEKDEIFSGFMEELNPESKVYKNTLRLVECSMFASVSALTYLLSSSLAIENYFGCFFALPIVNTSMRWGVSAGRKSMVATAVLLFVLSGPIKALTYLLMHGLLGFAMGSLWRLQVKWSLSIILCTLVRAIGALGNVLIASFLIRENILALISANLHATLTLIFSSAGFNIIPSMSTIYAIFGFVLFLNCFFFVFLLHILYALFLTRLGMKGSLVLPRWLANAL